jgi:hypothetical protein
LIDHDITSVLSACSGEFNSVLSARHAFVVLWLPLLLVFHLTLTCLVLLSVILTAEHPNTVPVGRNVKTFVGGLSTPQLGQLSFDVDLPSFDEDDVHPINHDAVQPDLDDLAEPPVSSQRGHVDRHRLTFGTVNAKFLLTDSMEKVQSLALLLRQLKWPDIFVVTELGRAAGTDARMWLDQTDILRQYSPFWTNRSISKHGGAADDTRLVGAGVLLLVHRRLRANVSCVKIDMPNDDACKLDGHFRVWRLDPSPKCSDFSRALLNPLILTAVYVPPTGEWASLVRSTIMDALQISEQLVLDARRVHNVDHIILGHFNAQCSDCPVLLNLERGSARIQEIAPVLCEQFANAGRGRLELSGENLWLYRRTCLAADSHDAIGKSLIELLQRFGMCPTSGVMSHCMPTTWTQCYSTDCLSRGFANCLPSCGKSRLRNVNDLCFVDSDLVVDALLSPGSAGVDMLKLVSRRLNWSDKIDHAVTWGHVLLRPPVLAAVQSIPSSSNIELTQSAAVGSTIGVSRQRKRMRLPDDRSLRATVQHRTAEFMRYDSKLSSAFDLSAAGALSLSVRDAVFCESARTNFQQSLNSVENPNVPAELRRSDQSQRQICRAAWKHHHSARRAGNSAALKVANRQIRRLCALRRMQHRHRRARAISSSVTSAPKLHWRLLQENVADPGAPVEGRCKLLDRLNDRDGNLISTDKEQIRQRLLDYRKSVFQIRSDFDSSFLDSIYSDCLLLSDVNRMILEKSPGFSANSVVSQSSTDAKFLWRGQTPVQFDETHRQLASTKLKRCCSARDRFGTECVILERDFCLDELKLVLRELDDTGTGIDGVSPASLVFLEDSTCKFLLDFFNEIWRTGVLPESWSMIRVVLHFKGKGSDPYCADNYRGLGIGAVLEKILSLMMMKRLESFLLGTKALHCSQGGFLPQRGPPEQVFTLSEAVRVTLKRDAKSPASVRPVHLCFLDIEKAYDSVQHVKLWARCAELGIGGRFLSTLQAMYSGKQARLDVNGELLAPQDIECGVLQGNPLSPLLFNIYIDPVLHKIEQAARLLGDRASISLPYFIRDAHGNVVSDPTRLASILASLFFADDGVLLARDSPALQHMIDVVISALRDIGLTLNAKKTKVLVVPRLGSSAEEYEKLKRAISTNGGFVASGRSVDLVDDFMYLGVCVCWQWDWSLAWKSAQRRARAMLFKIRQSGFQNQGAALIYQYRFACCQVLSHLDYVSALAGVEGNSSSIAENERIVSDLLRTISRLPPKFCGDSLKAEFGTWQQVARIRMLQLRFFTKLTLMDSDSTHFRTLCLSRQLSEPARLSGKACLWNWYDKAIRSARLFSADNSILPATPSLEALSKALCPSVALVALQFFDSATGQWVSVPHLLWWLLPNSHGLDLRLVSTSASAFGVDYVFGTQVFAWPLPRNTGTWNALSCWSPQMQCAVFASLRKRGNKFRHEHFVSKLFGSWASPDSGQRDFVAIKAASYAEPYLFCTDSIAANQLLKRRVGGSNIEFYARRCPRSLPQIQERCLDVLRERHVSASLFRHGRVLPRLEPDQRACYTCPSDCWLPETTAHVFLDCLHPAMVAERLKLKADLMALSAESASVAHAPPSPDFDDPVALFTVLVSCTGVGSLQHIPAADAVYSLNALVPIGAQTFAALADDQRARSLAERRRNYSLALHSARMRPAATWVAFFANRWVRAIATQTTDEFSAVIGERLLSLICSHSQRVHSARRRALHDNIGFAIRDRDPGAELL